MLKGVLSTRIIRKSTKPFLFCIGLLLPFNSYAFVAKMEDIPVENESYSRAVLDKVLSAYDPPLETKGSAKVLVRIGRDGRPYSCELKNQVSGYEIYNAVCNAVLNVQPFGALQTGMQQAEIMLVFEHDEPYRGISSRVLPPITTVNEVFENTANMPSQNASVAGSVNGANSNVSNSNISMNANVEEIPLNSVDATPVADTANIPSATSKNTAQALASATNKSTNSVDTTGAELEVVELSPAAPIVGGVATAGALAVENVSDFEDTSMQGENIALSQPIGQPVGEPIDQAGAPSFVERYENEVVTQPAPSSVQTGANTESYAKAIRDKVQSQILVPLELKPGTYNVQVGMMVDAAGELLYYSVLETSGSEYADDAVVRTLTSRGMIPPTPSGQEEEIILDFTVVK